MTTPSRRRLTLVVNPVAGGGRGARVADAVRSRLCSLGYTIATVSAPDAAGTRSAVAAAVATGVDGVVALGGDGLAHLVLQELAGTDVPLGIVPVGTGNDLAAAFAIPSDPLAAADLVATGTIRSVDAVRSGDRWWASVLCSGFDSAVNERANRMRWPRGPRRYDLALLAELIALRTRDFTIEYDDEVWSGPALLVAVGNTGRYGGGYRMVSQADPADGRLDLTVVGPVGRAELVRMLPRVKAGTHLDHPAVTTLQATCVRMRAEGMVAYADGERLGPLPMSMTCARGALRLWTPA